MRKIILYIIGVLILALALFLFYKLVTAKEKKLPPPVKEIKTVFVDTVKNTTVPIVVPANGSLVAKERVELYAEVQGIFRNSAHPFKAALQPGANLVGDRCAGVPGVRTKCQEQPVQPDYRGHARLTARLPGDLRQMAAIPPGFRYPGAYP